MNNRDLRKENLHRFVGHLISLARRAINGDSGARAALARLRRALGKPPGAALEALEEVLPHLSADAENREYANDRATYLLLGSLFALHPKHSGGPRNLGTTLRLLGTENESAVKRFTNLLAARREQLPDLLRQAVSLAQSEDYPINYYRLGDDLLGWDDEARWVQLNWAREYWPPRNSAGGNDTPADAGTGE